MEKTLKPGDKVRVKTLDQFRDGFKGLGPRTCFLNEGVTFTDSMSRLCGHEMTIRAVNGDRFTLEEDDYRRDWCLWMFDFSPEPKTQDGRRYYFHHIRTKKKKKLKATIVGVYDAADNLLLSAAVCSKKDQFSKKRGRELAIARLNICHMAAFHYNPSFMPDDLQSRGGMFKMMAECYEEFVIDNPHILIPLPKEAKYNESKEKV